jgi:hypothetical protein
MNTKNQVENSYAVFQIRFHVDNIIGLRANWNITQKHIAERNWIDSEKHLLLNK